LKNYEVSSGSSVEEQAANTYRDVLARYAKELFDRIYFHMVASKLEDMHNNDEDFRSKRIVIGHENMSVENYGEKIEFFEDRCTYRFIEIPAGRDVIDVWKNVIKPTDGSITLYILASDEDVENREVRVK